MARPIFGKPGLFIGAASVIGGAVMSCSATGKALDILDKPASTDTPWFEFKDGAVKFSEKKEDELHEIAVKRARTILAAYLPGAGLIAGGLAIMIAVSR